MDGCHFDLSRVTGQACAHDLEEILHQVHALKFGAEGLEKGSCLPAGPLVGFPQVDQDLGQILFDELECLIDRIVGLDQLFPQEHQNSQSVMFRSSQNLVVMGLQQIHNF